ncbi:MAG: hypothetical protein R2794_06750 [Chitinophagales bacterium]
MEITEEQHSAAGAIVELISEKLSVKHRIHAATAITAGARLAGSFMFRSFGFELKDAEPGSVVLSEEANEKGPVLIGVLQATLENFGVRVEKEMVEKTEKADAQISFMKTMNTLQGPAHDIMQRNALRFEQMAYSCAIATAFIIKECQANLDIGSAFNTAMYGFIEGSKTCPPEIRESVQKKKDFFSFWKKMR